MDGEPMNTTTKNAPEAGHGFEGSDHDDSAEDLMNISTVADPTDTDVRVPGFHQGDFKDKHADVYLLGTHDEPFNPTFSTRIFASPFSMYENNGKSELAEPGYQWGDDPDDPTSRPGEFVFVSMGLHRFVGYEIDVAPGITHREAFTGVFRKIEEVR
jgi:hypothetical protein